MAVPARRLVTLAYDVPETLRPVDDTDAPTPALPTRPLVLRTPADSLDLKGESAACRRFRTLASVPGWLGTLSADLGFTEPIFSASNEASLSMTYGLVSWLAG